MAGFGWPLRVSRIIVLCPSYFPVFHDCDMVGLPYVRIYMTRDSTGWNLPTSEILRSLEATPNTALWVTNPVYCTGFYLGSAEATFLQGLLARGVNVVQDEFLALCGHEIGRQLEHSQHLLGLYSP